MDEKELALLVLVPTIVFIFISSGIVFLIYTYYKTKQQHLHDKQQAELLLIKELNRTKIEIQDETLTYIGRELHDNIGQLLTVSKIHSNSLLKEIADNKKLIALDSALEKTMLEVKALSKSLDSSRIENFGLQNEIANEVEQINKLQHCQVDFDYQGKIQFSTDCAIMLYRIIQEFLSNAVKYSQCRKILIQIHCNPTSIMVTLHDDGHGFDISKIEKGSGLINMERRANLLNASDFFFDTQLGAGTTLSFTIQNG